MYILRCKWSDFAKKKKALISQLRGVERASGVLGMPCQGTRHDVWVLDMGGGVITYSINP